MPRLLKILNARVRWIAVGLMGLLALVAGRLEQFRLTSPERAALIEFIVTNGNDAGVGSLREGIFAADRAPSRARVVIAAGEIVVNTPLPPLVNPHGVVLDATRSHARLIVAATPDAGPILDLAAPNSLVAGLRIVNAPAEGILIRAADVRLQDVTVEASQIGVFVADDVSNISITESAFLNNEIGVQVPASAAGITIQGNRFQDHRRAAVWAVAPVARPDSESQLKIVRNRFKNDNQSMLVINGNVRIDGNVIEGARASAAFVSGAAAIVEENRIRAGFGFGIELSEITYGIVADNELDHNCAGGVLVRGSRNTHVTANRIYANGTGIVLVRGDIISPAVVDDNLIVEQWQDGVHLIGSSPVIRHNQLLRNRVAALRISTLVTTDRQTRQSSPRLDDNALDGNGRDEPWLDDYSLGPADREPQLQDCHWRLARSAGQLALAGVGR